jgi:hypothetical protein
MSLASRPVPDVEARRAVYRLADMDFREFVAWLGVEASRAAHGLAGMGFWQFATWAAIGWAIIFIPHGAGRKLFAVRTDLGAESWQGGGRPWYRWPLLPLLFLFDLLESYYLFLERTWLQKPTFAFFTWLFRWRLARAIVTFELWRFLTPWTRRFWLPTMYLHTEKERLISGLVYVALCWPAASLLGSLTRNVPRPELYRAFKVVIAALSVGIAITLYPYAPNACCNPPLFIEEWGWGPSWEKFWRMFDALLYGGLFALSLAAPLWTFWKPPSVPGPKYGDAQFADEASLRGRGIVNER